MNASTLHGVRVVAFPHLKQCVENVSENRTPPTLHGEFPENLKITLVVKYFQLQMFKDYQMV